MYDISNSEISSELLSNFAKSQQETEYYLKRKQAISYSNKMYILWVSNYED